MVGNALDLFAHHDVFFVGVHCPLEILIERERERGDRPIGSAKKDYETIHAGKIYDIELHSTDEADANVEKLLVNWQHGTDHPAFP